LGIVAELEAEGYHDAEPVGRGGFGVVYRCNEPSLDRVVAVKVLSSDQDDVDLEQFAREQRAMGRVSGHPNIVPVLHSGLTFTGRPYIVMQYHRRNTLAAWIHDNGPFGVREALTIGVRLAGALETAHRAGVLHRDVKPANVLLTDYGEPQLSDFGIARISGSREMAANIVVGSPSYTAPELFAGRPASTAADVYSLAATVFTLLSGDPPFPFKSGENPIVFARRVKAGPIPDLRANGVPDPICSALELGLNIDPEPRPTSAAAFGEILRTAATQVGLNIADVPLELPAPATLADESVSGTRTPVSAAHSAALGARSDESASIQRAHYPPSAPTRFRPPTFNRPTVPRQRILDRLGSGPRPKLVLIHAPAGYGKSTLAAQWAETLTRQGLKAAWLAIDSDDNNAAWFVAHVTEAIRRTLPDLADTLQQEFEVHLNAPQYVFNALINCLHSDKQTLALVMEDWHRVSNAETTNALSYLLENSCHHLHLIVTSRTRAGLPLSAMAVQGELTEIDSSLLKFDVAESQALLVDQCGLDLTAANVAELEDSTDGWAAALQLVSLSLRDHSDPAALIQNLSGRHRAIGEYLASNVLDSLEPDLLEFLLSTCITKQICGGLATALTGNRRSQSILEEIEKRDLFLRRTDTEGSWFQYHHLFADYLLHRLQDDAEDRIPELHRKAAQWFSEHQMLSQAVDHLMLAGEEAQAVDAVEHAAPDLNEQSKMSTLIGLVAKLPAQHADARPRLQVDLAWADAVLHRSAAAQDALRLAEATIDSVPVEQAGDLRAEMNLIRAVLADFQDRMDTSAARDAVQACVERADTLHPWILCRAADVGSSRAIRVFDFDDALRWHRWGHQYHQRISGALTVAYGYCFAAIAENEQLDVAGAESHLRHAIRIALLPSGRPSYVAKLAGSLLGALLYEQGQLDEAEALLDGAYELGAEGGLVDFMLVTFGTGARLKFTRGDPASARRRLAEGLDIARTLQLPRLEAGLLNETVRLAAISAEPMDESVTRRITSAGSQPLDEIGNVTAELTEDSQIRLLLIDGAPSALAATCQRARARVEHVDRDKRPRAHLRATIQLALCLAAAGDTHESQRVLTPALRTCAALGLRQLLIDEGPQMLHLAKECVTQTDGSLADDAVSANVRDFALSLAEAS
jgi:serine/threonine-protein kinase/serine/threonine-protein kinase PknK